MSDAPKLPRGRPIPPSEAVLFCRHGHAIIASRKLSQLFATGWIGKAIGQRSAFLSAGVPALRACNRRSYFDRATEGGRLRDKSTRVTKTSVSAHIWLTR